MDIVLETKGLSKKYGNFTALQPLDLSLNKGEILGYLGPNGSGKTTTIRLLLGLIKASAGKATIFGLDAQTQKVNVHKRTAYVPGETMLWPSLTGEETLHLLGKLHGEVDIPYRKRLIKRFEFDQAKKVRTYSKGNRQKIALISALSTRADLLILDEPTSGLDPIMEQAFRESIAEARQRGQSVFLSSHILDEVEALCDQVAILRLGKLVEVGTLSDMRHLSALSIEAIFDESPPKVDHIKGVSQVNITGHQLNCQIQGPVAELLQVISAAKPKVLLSREPSLEELFLSLYGAEEERIAKS